MTRDYAKPRMTTQPSYQKRAAARAKSSATPGWLWLFAGLLMGSLMVGLYWFIERQQHAATITPPQEGAPKAKAKPKQPRVSAEKPRFDFYTLLPNMEATVPDSAQTETSPKTEITHEFLIQVGAFRQYADADSLKANLVLMGFDEPKLQSFEAKPQEQWFRVLLGPFKDETSAQAVQQELQAQQLLNTIILKK